MKKKYRTLIVDDERLARKDLRSLLEEYEEIEVVGEAENVPMALDLIEKTNPDLIFLDIQMPGETGFDLLDQADTRAKVIFVTAYDEYALRAFEVNALDYLLKPINPVRLRLSLERLESEGMHEERAKKMLSDDDRLFILLNTRYKFLKVSSIVCICSAGDYSEVHTADGQKGLANKPMSEWEERLPENSFCRIHRSTIINLDYVERLEDWFNNAFRVYMKGIPEPFVMSRRFASRLKDKMA